MNDFGNKQLFTAFTTVRTCYKCSLFASNSARTAVMALKTSVRSSLIPVLSAASSSASDCTKTHSTARADTRQLHSSTSTFRSHYDVLGLSPKATHDQIKAAYYKLSKEYHPDLNKSEEAEKKFSEISAAYETLSNSSKRKLYDGDTFRRGSGLQSAVRTRKAVNPIHDVFVKNIGKFRERPFDEMLRPTEYYHIDEHYRQHYGKYRAGGRNIHNQNRGGKGVTALFILALIAAVQITMFWVPDD